jgi:uncharacterized membrane protein
MVIDKLKGVFGKPEWFFVAFAGFFGLILVFLTPPLQSPDEQAHFYQTYAFANLDFVAQEYTIDSKVHYGSELPKSVYEASSVFLSVAGDPKAKFNKAIYKEYIFQDLNPKETDHLGSGTVNTPLVYLPQSTGINIGKLFNASPLVMIWLGRIMNLLAWLLLVYFAIKMFPVAKWALVVFALNPVSVFLSATLTADVVNVGLAFLFTSLVFAAALSKKVLTKKQLLIIGLVLIGLALTKTVNILFVGLLLAIPWRRYGSIKKLIIFTAAVALIAGVITLLWSGVTSDAVQASIQAQRPGMGVDSSGQLSWILHHPFDYVKILLQNYVIVQPGYYGDAVLQTLFGGFGWLDTSIPFWTIGLYVLVLYTALLYQMGRGGSLVRYQRLIFLGLFVVLAGASITALYLIYTPIGQKVVDGVQGRYFIPATLLLFTLFTARKKVLQISEKHLVLIIGGSMIIVLGMLLLRIFLRYYG